MKRKNIKEILYRISSGTASAEDEQTGLYWLHYFRRNDIPELSEEELTENTEAILHSLVADQTASRSQKTRFLLPRIAAAASVILCLLGGAYYMLQRKTTSDILQTSQKDIAPGGNNALLTLANGQKILLTKAGIGNLAIQHNTTISKVIDGHLTYSSETGTISSSAELTFNTLTTPRGGQYQLTLSDGTKVWLNAASSITFPVIFGSRERKVEITGEAYLEVVHHAERPFIVSVNGETIEDLGTQFNINAYIDEPENKTTLLQGSLKISRGAQAALLTPGQQAVVTNNGDISKISVINAKDLTDVVAWKNGQTNFTNADIKTIMRQVSRWYNIDVEYQGKVSEQLYNGALSRNSNLSALLKILAMNDVHFELQDRKIIIKP